MLPKIPSDGNAGAAGRGSTRKSYVAQDGAGYVEPDWSDPAISAPKKASKAASTGSLFREVKLESNAASDTQFNHAELYKHVVFPRLDEAARLRGVGGALGSAWEPEHLNGPVDKAKRMPAAEAAVLAKGKMENLWLVSALDHHTRTAAAYKTGNTRKGKSKSGKGTSNGGAGGKKAGKPRPKPGHVSSGLVEQLARVEAEQHRVRCTALVVQAGS